MESIYTCMLCDTTPCECYYDDEISYENAGHAENPDTGIDTTWYTEDYCINVFYEGM